MNYSIAVTKTGPWTPGLMYLNGTQWVGVGSLGGGVGKRGVLNVLREFGPVLLLVVLLVGQLIDR